jgi:hypothetical protein
VVSVLCNFISLVNSILNQYTGYPFKITDALQVLDTLSDSLYIFRKSGRKLLQEGWTGMIEVVKDFQFDVRYFTFIHENPIDENLISYHGRNVVVPVISLTVIPACLESFFKERSWTSQDDRERKGLRRIFFMQEPVIGVVNFI